MEQLGYDPLNLIKALFIISVSDNHWRRMSSCQNSQFHSVLNYKVYLYNYSHLRGDFIIKNQHAY